MSVKQEIELIEVFVHVPGLRDSTAVRVDATKTGNDLLSALRAQGIQVADGQDVILIEDTDHEVALDGQLSKSGVHHHTHVQVHRCHRIETQVAFNGATRSNDFSPAATVKKVTVWAAKSFGLSPVDAAEHCLQISQTMDRPDDDTHLGSLTSGGDCRVLFDLVPKSRVEG
jgi:hypothetical protein